MRREPTSKDHKTDRNARRALAAIIVLLIILLCGLLYVLSSITTEPGHEPTLAGVSGVEVVFQAFGGGALGEMELPYDVAYDGRNTIYVTVPDEGKVLAFDKSGRAGRVFVEDHEDGERTLEEYRVLAPAGIDVGPDGLVYIADRTKMAVVVFNSDGELVRHIPVMAPKGVTVAGDRVYVLSDVGTLFVTDLEGNPLGQWGTYGREDEQLSGAFAVAVDDEGVIYLSDLDNNRVIALSSDLEVLWRYGEPASISDQGKSRLLSSPAGIAVGGDGNVYVVDGLVSQIQVLDRSGDTFAPPLGEHGVNDDQFFFPKGIEWMEDDLFVLADTFHARVVGVRLKPQVQSTDTP
ncbi:MAG: NHL repeat-containing protein [Coriobacteriia bacterium]|nr:NHL repeat-containing protein [Coriobacteriia bacterium]